jgi:hypothetical protein
MEQRRRELGMVLQREPEKLVPWGLGVLMRQRLWTERVSARVLGLKEQLL